MLGPCLPTISSQTVYEDDICLIPIFRNIYIVQSNWPMVDFTVLSAMGTDFSRQ